MYIPHLDAYADFDLASQFSPAGIPGLTSLGALATIIVKFLISIVGILAIIFIIIAGIKIVSSGGDSKKLDGARATLTYAIIGLVVAILAFVIVNIVQKFLGSTVAITS